jgi:polar amino acid transport system substrate-binding protein
MLKDLLQAMFPIKQRQMLALFFASLFLTIGIAACSIGGSSSVKSLANVSTDQIASVAQSGKTLEKIIQTGKVRVAVPDDFPPFGSVGPDLSLRGYDVDVAKEVAKGLGVELELVPVVGNYRIPFLQTDRVDMVISSLGKNKDRALIIDFSEPYAPFFSGVYGGPNIGASSTNDLNGQTIGVAQGSLEDLEISKLPPGKIQIKRFASNSLTASALVSEQVDLIATGNITAAKLIRDNPSKQISSKFVLKNSPCYIGVRKGDKELLEKVNLIIAGLKQSGKLNQLSVTWLKQPLGNLSA